MWVRRIKIRERVKSPCVQEESKSGMGRKPGKEKNALFPHTEGSGP